MKYLYLEIIWEIDVPNQQLLVPCDNDTDKYGPQDIQFREFSN